MTRIASGFIVGITTGSYDVLAKATFRSNQDLLDFITTRLSRIPGIIRASTSSILDVVKRTVTYGLPAGFAGDGVGRDGVRPRRRPAGRRDARARRVRPAAGA